MRQEAARRRGKQRHRFNLKPTHISNPSITLVNDTAKEAGEVATMNKRKQLAPEGPVPGSGLGGTPAVITVVNTPN